MAIELKNIQQLPTGSPQTASPVIFGNGTDLFRTTLQDFLNLVDVTGISGINIRKIDTDLLLADNQATILDNVDITVAEGDFILLEFKRIGENGFERLLYLANIPAGTYEPLSSVISFDDLILINRQFTIADESSNTTTFTFASLAELNNSDPAIDLSDTNQVYLITLDNELFLFEGVNQFYGSNSNQMTFADLSLIGSEILQQSQVFTFYKPNNLDVFETINNANSFFISDVSSVIMRVINYQEIPQLTLIFKLISNPLNNSNASIVSGNFGTNGQQLVVSNLALLNIFAAVAEDIEDSPGTVIEDFGDLGTTTIIDHINGLTTGLVIADSATTLTILKSVVDNSPISFLYTGSGDTYGANDSELPDFEVEYLEKDVESTQPSGLQTIDEGNGKGFRLTGRNPDNYGNIGKHAVDTSISQSASTTNGATGFASFAHGTRNEAVGNFSIAFGGGDCVASGQASYVRGDANVASDLHSESTGSFNVSSAFHAITRGRNNFARSQFEHSFGKFGTDYTPANDDTDRLLNYGYGVGNNRKDIYTLFKNGAVRFFRATLASIQNTVKEGFLIFNSDDSNRPYIHDGTEWHGLAYKNVGYTVANLPTNAETGQTAYVTNAANISYRAIASAGGNDRALVFFDGTNWIYH